MMVQILIDQIHDFEEYDSAPFAYPVENRIMGSRLETERIQDHFNLMLLKDLEEKAHMPIYNFSDSNNIPLSLFEPFFVNPAINDYDYSGVDCMVDKSKKSEDELFREVYDAVDAIDISDLDVGGFIKYCEEQYSMTTEEFVVWFNENDNEGNVEMKLWALYARNLGVNR